MAIESAFVLARCLRAAETAEAGLKAYEQARFDRTAMITNQSWKYGKIFAYENPVKCWVRDRISGLLGGMALNLTPCVLPLIPINLAIIHGGRAAHSRREGFLHGAAYGTGMALTYRILGLVVVLTGSKFGTLNSSVWFNIPIAIVFAVLALAMFDVFHIDFARFDRLLGRREARGAHGAPRSLHHAAAWSW